VLYYARQGITVLFWYEENLWVLIFGCFWLSINVASDWAFAATGRRSITNEKLNTSRGQFERMAYIGAMNASAMVSERVPSWMSREAISGSSGAKWWPPHTSKWKRSADDGVCHEKAAGGAMGSRDWELAVTCQRNFRYATPCAQKH